jgi:hypothetical protein
LGTTSISAAIEAIRMEDIISGVNKRGKRSRPKMG